MISFSISHGCQSTVPLPPPAILPPILSSLFSLPLSHQTAQYTVLLYSFPCSLPSQICSLFCFHPTSKHSDMQGSSNFLPFPTSKHSSVSSLLSLLTHFQAQWCVLPYFSLFPLPNIVIYAPLFLPFPTSKHSDVCYPTP